MGAQSVEDYCFWRQMKLIGALFGHGKNNP